MTATLLAANPLRTGPVAPADPTARRFRRDIEGLRAIAVALVVLFHAGVTQIPGGYVGVDVFFVISGFLITQHLLAEATTFGRIRFARFYAARARRLLPLGTLVVILTVAGTWILTSPLETHQVGIDAMWASLLAINFYLTKAACPIYDFRLMSGQLKRDYTECYQWRTEAMERITADRPQ